MTPDITAINQAIQTAYQALQNGDHLTARRWAEKAAQLAPEMEDPWLILASVASPRASLAYLEQALKINPDSSRASVGLSWAQERLRQQATSKPTPAQSVQPAAVVQKPPAPKKRSYSSSLFLLFGSFFALLLLVFLVAATWIAWPGHFSKVEAFIAGSTATPTPSETFTLTSTSTATSTVTATVTNTPTPTRTATPTKTNTPIPSRTPTRRPTKKPTAVPKLSGAKRILVSISQQHLYAYQGNTLVYSFVASTGQNNGTLTGNFSILDKIPNAYSDPWGFYMPDWMGIYWAGADLENGIHSLPVLTSGKTIWGNEIGTPITYGCVVLETADANKLFSWADIGTPVQIVR
ncbi:MAG: L,D-transpeptidase family protein [Anaerolineaceae bacterium]|nr:L,D-transpeptidase family protein [Anaerolineaceae bacterium]